jgi:hypothetical protein
MGVVATGTWAEVDLTPIVTGNGVYSWGLVTGSNNAAMFSSSETSNPPQLVIDPG